MSATLRILEGLNDGSVTMDPADPRTDHAIRFVATLLRPIYNPVEQRAGARIR